VIDDARVKVVVPPIVIDLQVDITLKTGILADAGMVTSVFEEGTPALQFPATSHALFIAPSHVVDSYPAFFKPGLPVPLAPTKANTIKINSSGVFTL